MTSADLKKLSRGELLEMLIAQTEENAALKARLQKAEKELHDRSLRINNAGSIAEAALQLNGVFQAADAAAQQYLENIRELSEQQDEIRQQIEDEAQLAAQAIIAEAEEYSLKLRNKTKKFCKKKIEEVQAMYDEQLNWTKLYQSDEGAGGL